VYNRRTGRQSPINSALEAATGGGGHTTSGVGARGGQAVADVGGGDATEAYTDGWRGGGVAMALKWSISSSIWLEIVSILRLRYA